MSFYEVDISLRLGHLYYITILLNIIIIFGHVDKEIVNKIGKHVTKVPVSGKNKSGSTVLNLKLSHKHCSCFKTRVSQLMLIIISQ